jgi:hypothetical protein
VAAAAGFGILWFSDKIWPPPDPGEQVMVEHITAAGIDFELERKGRSGYSAVWGDASLGAEVGPNKVRYEDGILFVNQVDYESLRPHDRVRVTVAGEVLVNGRPRAPHPIQPRRITPPEIVLAGHTADTWSLYRRFPRRVIHPQKDTVRVGIMGR